MTARIGVLIGAMALLAGCGIGIPAHSNSLYLAQPVPGVAPERFAPGIVSTGAIELNGVFSADAKAFYFTRIVDGLDTIHEMIDAGGTWSQPRQLMLFPDKVRVESADMTLSADAKTLYVLAKYAPADAGEKPNYDIWRSRRVNGEWSTAERLPPPINTAADELYPVLGRDGSLYLNSNRDGVSAIYRFGRNADGSFGAPVKFGPAISDPHGAGDMSLAPDGHYIVMSLHPPGGRADRDLYVAFRKPNGDWTTWASLGDGINTPSHEWCPMVTPDGKYLLFSRLDGPAGPPWAATTRGDVYWVDTRVLDQVRARE
jgi:hypothetical protein